MKLEDKRVKANHDIRDSFLKVPNKLTTKQKQALAKLKQLLKYEMKDKANA